MLEFQAFAVKIFEFDDINMGCISQLHYNFIML